MLGDQHVHPPPPGAPSVVAVRTLPRDVAAFTGRADEVERLLAAAGQQRVVAIHAVEGMPGVGKTALVTHVAHRLADRFPDGQLFVGLHAHTPGLAAADPAEVLYGLLVGTGMQPDQIPPGLDERARWWRDRMAGKRVLLVLDDAAGHGQIEPLLPGAPGCLVLITSRRPIDLDDADPLLLGVLADEEAIALFTRLTRHTFTGEQAGQVAELVGRCAGLPLAIALLAGKVRRHLRRPGPGLAELAARFAEADRLTQLTAGGRPGDRAVTVAFDMSYRDLPPDRQRLFRLLGLHPGPDIDAYAAAALTAAPLAHTRDLLEALREEYLLQPLGAGRYRMHDLLRDYARTLAAHDPATDRDTALDRLLDYYTHSAQVAVRYLPRSLRSVSAPAASTMAGPDLRDHAEALGWMRTERANLLACIDHATTHQLHERTITLTTALASLFHQDGPWSLASALHQNAIAAARHTHNHLAHANALNDLGRVRTLVGDYVQAADLLGQARALYRDLANRLGVATTLSDLGRIRALTGDLVQAADLQGQALALYRDLGNRGGVATSLWELGRIRLLAGDYAQAIGLQEQALALYRDLGDRIGVANALNDLGRIRFVIDDSVQATDLLEQARALYRDLGNRLGEANALNALGRVRILVGDFVQAADLQEQAWALYRDLGNRHGVATTLSDLGRIRALTGDLVQAADLQGQALALYRDLGNRGGVATSLWELGRIRLLAGDYAQAIGLQEQALALYRDLGDRHGEANALNDLGRISTLTGEHLQASGLFEQALMLFREVGDRQGEAETLCGMGELLAETAALDQASAVYEQALGLARQIGSPLDEAHALEGTARTIARAGEVAAAIGPLREAVGIYERLGVPEAASAAAYLAELEARHSAH
ncbi:tetratricopeptide repeat protein [Actinomadura sp. NEAU-AAG7]|uniref:ATP-binding protein n=1 Tax=Actinomadura sp. NEAU-AAG7 TaxID=2839640 RepID=UPI001BE3F780|nr:tetratricopeptide repeat protein [Actinomadura sp. NEAU-AAG7]MBT2212563.1 tetratricopeptide repeat protein [Actinomadura sp. NEAU-AAG7]